MKIPSPDSASTNRSRASFAGDSRDRTHTVALVPWPVRRSLASAFFRSSQAVGAIVNIGGGGGRMRPRGGASIP